MELLLPYAHDKDGIITHIDNARKGQKYTCPNCGAELSLRISKIPPGQKYHRRSHFAHKGGGDNHCSESYLHQHFKEKCVTFLREQISQNEPLYFHWECEKCNEEHKGNLLHKVVEVFPEYSLGVCKPDIALVDSQGKVVSVIEVIVTHRPEDIVLKYYEEHKILCLQINVKEFSDCDTIAEKISTPTKVNLCPNPTCDKCGEIMHSAKLVVRVVDCYTCDHKMKVAMIETPYNTLSPMNFNNEEISMAQDLGVIIEQRHSKTLNSSYFANVCGHCGAFVGDFYMHDYYEIPPEHEIDLDYKCSNCMGMGDDEIDADNEDERTRTDTEVENTMRAMEGLKKCPNCGGMLKVRRSYIGVFWGCENYPQCRYTENTNT